MPKTKPRPRRYHGGWLVNFEHPSGTRHQKRFPARRFSDPYQTACEYIDGVLGGRTSEWQPLSAVVRAYLSWAERTGKKVYSTVASDCQRLTTFVDWAKQRRIESPRDISLEQLRAFYEWFLANFPLYRNNRRRYLQALPPDERNRRRLATWEKYRLSLSAFFNWCVDRQYLDRNPLAKAKEFRAKLQQQLAFRVFSKEDLGALFAWLDANRPGEVASYFRLLAYTGFRAGEAEHLEWSAVDFRSNRIQVVGHTKNKKIRSVPMKPELRRCLEELHGQAKRRSGLIFADAKGKPTRTHDAWYKLFQTALKQTGLGKARIHDLRHTFGAQLAMAGVPLTEIQRLLGHAKSETTEIYIHFAPEHLDQAIQKLPY